MGLFEKVKNIFTEEVEEEQPIRKEVMHVEIPSPKEKEEEIEEIIEPKEEKFAFPVYFDDSDFEDLTPKKEEKKEIKEIKVEPKREIYGSRKLEEVAVHEKKFAPSPIISPVYGVLNKNYIKEDIVNKSTSSIYRNTAKTLSVDDVRKKAYGSLEDDIESTLFDDDPIYNKEDLEKVEDSSTNYVEDKIVEDYKPEKENVEDNLTLEELNKMDSNDDIKYSESDLFNLIDSMYEEDDKNG